MNAQLTRAGTVNATLRERFTTNATTVGTHVAEVDSDGQLAQLVEALAAGGRVMLAPALAAGWPALLDALRGRGVELRVPDTADPASSFEGVTVGVSRADLGVAETGSLVVADGLSDRLVRMLAPKHVALLDVDAIVLGLDEAGAWLRDRVIALGDSAARYVSFITGPSRTADIEMSLTVGAHGPAELHVALVAPSPRHGAPRAGGEVTQ